MGRTLGSLLRISGPHRILLAFAVAFVYSVFLSGDAGSAEGGRLGVVLVPAVGALLIVALGAIRLGLAAVGAGASVVLVVLLVLSGSWMAVAIAVAAIAADIVYFIVSPALARRLPVEMLFTGVEGAAVPTIGFLLFSGGWKVPLELLAVTALLLFSLAVAASLREDSRGVADLVDLPSLVTPVVASILSLAAGSGAIAVTLGGGFELRPELALLASSVAIMCVFFGWMSLVERRVEWRAQRVAALVASSAVTLSIGLVVVMLFA